MVYGRTLEEYINSFMPEEEEDTDPEEEEEEENNEGE